MEVKGTKNAIRTRVRVTGRVQGVSYRMSAAQAARRLGLVGWVRNKRDGSVELEIQGTRAKVLEMVSWCRRGPAAAEVTGVTEEPAEPSDAEHSFRIRDSA